MKPVLVILATAVLAIGISVSAYADINKGIVAAWTFDDGKVTDVVGDAHGELFKAAKIADKGKYGKALDVDGSKDTRADIEFNADLEKIIEGPHTVAYWLYVRNGADHSGVWKGEKVGWGAFFTFRMVTTSSTGLTWGTTNGGSENWFATDGAIEAEKWFLLCQTADGEEAIGYVALDGKVPEIPVSGQQNPHIAPEPYNLFPDRPLELGAGRQIGGNQGNDMFLDGMIDDVIIWDRALSEDEVADLAKGQPSQGLAVKAEGKLATTWGKVKSYHHR